MQYKIQSIIVKLAHAHGYKVGGDYALYVLGVPAKYLPRMDHLRVYGTSLDIDKFIKTLDVLYGVKILQTDMKPFVHKIYVRLGKHEKIHIYYSNLQDPFMYSKDMIMLSNDGIEVVSTDSLSVLGSRAMQTLEMTKRREFSLFQNMLLESHVSSWDYISSQIDYMRLGWKIHPEDTWAIYIKKEMDDCSICQNSIHDDIRIKTACGHRFHYDCLKQWVMSGDYGWKCPMCRSSKLILYKNCVP